MTAEQLALEEQVLGIIRRIGMQLDAALWREAADEHWFLVNSGRRRECAQSLLGAYRARFLLGYGRDPAIPPRRVR